jgi:uncharacterized damage-inducible protein DinB
MPRKPPWIDRRFAFDLPVDMFPNVLERLRGTPARIEERLAPLTPDRLVAKPGDAWSIQEIVGHLTIVEGLWLARLDDFAAGLDELTPADMSNRATEEAGFNAQEPDAVLADFRAARAGFVARLAALSDDEIGRAARHPRLDQPMRVLDLMVFAAEHDDHHLAGITEILEAT